MKKLLSLLLGLSMMISAVPVVMADEPAAEESEVIEIHVAPNGDSMGTGAIDDPLNSLASAKSAVAKVKAENPGKPIDVIFHEGEYRFTDTVSFQAADSGSPEAPITYRAAEGEKVEFKGSQEIDLTAIQAVKDAAILAKLPASSRGKVGYINLAEQGITELGPISSGFNMWLTAARFQESEIYLDNKKQTLARWPNGENGYDTFDTVVSAGSTGTPDTGVGGTFTTKDFRLMNWENAKDAWAVGFWGVDYYYEKVPIGKINTATKEVTLKYSSVYGLNTAFSRRFAVINLLEELDMPGEYYIDYDTKTLYYYPERTLAGARLEITTLGKNLVELRQVSNLNFEGLTFTQARGNAISLVGKTENINITGCTFENLGRLAIHQFYNSGAEIGKGTAQASQFVTDGSVNLHVNNNSFKNIGYRAIEMFCGDRDTNVPSNCTFNNNHFYAIGTANPSAYGVQIYGVGVEIANNTIHQAGYGIGWVGADFDIHHNEIYNVMNQLNDGSAIYTGRNFINRGNKVHHNYIHDASEKSEHMQADLCAGIYLDDYDCGTEVYQNIIRDTHMALLVNNGMSNIVRDNIAVDSPRDPYRLSEFLVNKQGAVDRAKIQGEKALANSGYDRYPDIAEDLNSGLLAEPAKNTIVNNLSLRGKFAYNDRLQSLNKIENNHEVEETEFVDPANGDYRLKSTSKYAQTTDALTEDFDMSTIGVQLDEFGENPMLSEDFKMIYPANGTRGLESDKITFSWQRPLGADRFTVKIATDSKMENIIKTVETYESAVTIDSFEKGGTYYWQVYANNESILGAETIESAGVPRLFTIAASFKADTTDLQALVIAAKDKLTKMIEGDEIGEYKVGTKQALEEKIESAERMIKYGGYSEKEQQLLIDDLDSLVNSDDFINGGYKDLGDFMADTENWVVREEDNYLLDPENKTVKVDAYGKTINVLSYMGVQEYSRVLALSFKMKVDFADGGASRWIGMGLRGAAPTQPCYQSGNDQYFMTMKEGLLEYQRNSGGTNQLLEVVEDENIKNNEWMDIDFGVINLGGVGQLTILKINGRVAYQAVDSSDNMVLKKGYFQLTTSGETGVEIKAADKPLESFDALVDEYTLKMTTDFCTELESANSSKAVILRSGSKKAYYNGAVQDVPAPVGSGNDIAVSAEFASQVFGGVISGDSITIGAKTYALPARDANGMFNLQALAGALGKTAYLYSDMQLVFVSDNLDLHVANFIKQFKGASDSLELYK